MISAEENDFISKTSALFKSISTPPYINPYFSEEPQKKYYKEQVKNCVIAARVSLIKLLDAQGLRTSDDFKKNLDDLIVSYNHIFGSPGFFSHAFNSDAFEIKDSKNGYNFIDMFKLAHYAFNYQNEKDFDEQLHYIKQITDILLTRIEIPSKKNPTTFILPDFIANGAIVKAVYLSGNKALIETFAEFVPTPPSKLFLPGPIPEVIAQQESEKQGIIAEVRSRISLDDETSKHKRLEDIAIFIQRNFRRLTRQQELLTLIEEKYRQNFKYVLDPRHKGNPKEKAREALIEANSVFNPKLCEAALAQRMLKIVNAPDFKLFHTAIHRTSPEHIANILDDGLFGRKSLLSRYRPFKEAILLQSDVLNGDADLICFAPQEVDPKTIKEGAETLEITFNLDKIGGEIPNYHGAFKQRDFFYSLPRDIFKPQPEAKERDIGRFSLNIGKFRKVNFKIEDEVRFGNEPSNNFIMILELEFEGQKLRCSVDKFLLISQNFAQMPAILTMNFFRILESSPNQEAVKAIYGEIAKFEDGELKAFLAEVGKKISIIAEINFYEMLSINFESIVGIKLYSQDADLKYLLNLEQFIEELKTPNLQALERAQENIPKLFESNRFLEYLLSQKLPRVIAQNLEDCQTRIEINISRDKRPHPMITRSMVPKENPQPLAAAAAQDQGKDQGPDAKRGRFDE